MSDTFSVDPAQVSGLASRLNSAGKALFGSGDDLLVSPDAGSSTAAVAQAMSALAACVAGLANHIGALSDSASASATTYAQSDQDATHRLPGGAQ